MFYIMLLTYPLLSASSVAVAKAGLTRLQRKQTYQGLVIIGGGTGLFAVGLSSFVVALSEIPLTIAVLIAQPFNVALSVLLGIFFFGERIDRRGTLGLGLLVGGMILVLSRQ